MNRQHIERRNRQMCNNSNCYGLDLLRELLLQLLMFRSTTQM